MNNKYFIDLFEHFQSGGENGVEEGENGDGGLYGGIWINDGGRIGGCGDCCIYCCNVYIPFTGKLS